MRPGIPEALQCFEMEKNVQPDANARVIYILGEVLWGASRLIDH